MDRKTTNTKSLRNSVKRIRRNSSNHVKRRQSPKTASPLGRNQLYSIKWVPFHFVQDVSTTDVLTELYRVYSLSPGFTDFQISSNTRPEQLCHELLAKIKRLVPDYSIAFTKPQDEANSSVKLIFYKTFDAHNAFYYGDLQTVAEQKGKDPVLYRFLCSVFTALIHQGLTEIAEGKASLSYFRKQLEFRFNEELAELLTEEERDEMANNHRDVLQRHDEYVKAYLPFLKDRNRSRLSAKSLRTFVKRHGLIQTYGAIIEHGLDLVDNPFGTRLSDFISGITTDDYNTQVYPHQYIVCGWDMESPIERDYVDYLDSQAQEGSISPVHVFHVEDTWKWPVIDNAYLDKLVKFYRAIDNLQEKG